MKKEGSIMSKMTLRRRHSSLADSDIVKRGTLHIKRPPTNLKIRLKTWQRRYFVLRDDSYDRGSRLEIYPSEASWVEGHVGDRLIIDLRKVAHIEEYRESRSFPYAFTITRRAQAPLILGTESETEMREWIVAVQLLACKTLSKCNRMVSRSERNGLSLSLSLNESLSSASSHSHPDGMNSSCDSSLHLSGIYQRSLNGSQTSSCPPTPGKDRKKYGYLVEVQPSPAAQRNSLKGDYRIQIVTDFIALHRVDVDMEVMRWGLVHIRKFKAEVIPSTPGLDLVTLEANVHCGHREGTYLFKTTHGRELISRVREALRRITVRKTHGPLGRETPSPVNTLTRLGPRHKSESEPTLGMCRSPTPPYADYRFSGDSSPDYPPIQRAPVPSRATNGSPMSMQHSRDSSPELDDDLPPPYLEVLAADDILPEVTSIKDDIFTNDDERNSGDNRLNQSFDSVGESLSSSLEQVASDRMLVSRGSIDSCPDVPPPPPPRPKHTLSHRTSPVRSRAMSTKGQHSLDSNIPPPLPPRDF